MVHQALTLDLSGPALHHVQQRTPCDCGVACLAMVANVDYAVAHSAFVLNKLDYARPGRRPLASNFRELTACARTLGIALRMAPFRGFDHLPELSILKVSDGVPGSRNWHWIVAVRVIDGVELYNPQPGSIRIVVPFRVQTPPDAFYHPAGNILALQRP